MDVIFDNMLFRSFGLKVKNTNHLNSFERNVEFIEVAGRNGGLIIDNKNYKNKDIEISCLLDCRNINNKVAIEAINKHFQTYKGYKKLKFSDGYEFLAAVKGQIVYNELFNNFYEVSIVFSAKKEDDNELYS